MTLSELVSLLNLELLTPGVDTTREVHYAYVSDLLSAVLASAQEGELWITVQRHVNIVAVAKVASLAGILLSGGVRPSTDVLAKAEQVGIPILATEDSSFIAAGKLYCLLFPKGVRPGDIPAKGVSPEEG